LTSSIRPPGRVTSWESVRSVPSPSGSTSYDQAGAAVTSAGRKPTWFSLAAKISGEGVKSSCSFR
jgi:hypothetical protein